MELPRDTQLVCEDETVPLTVWVLTYGAFKIRCLERGINSIPGTEIKEI